MTSPLSGPRFDIDIERRGFMSWSWCVTISWPGQRRIGLEHFRTCSTRRAAERRAAKYRDQWARREYRSEVRRHYRGLLDKAWVELP